MLVISHVGCHKIGLFGTVTVWGM